MGMCVTSLLCVGVILRSPIPTTAAEDVGGLNIEFELTPLSDATDVTNLEVMLVFMNGTAS